MQECHCIVSNMLSSCTRFTFDTHTAIMVPCANDDIHVLQVDLRLNATAGVEGAGSAVTSSADILGALLVAAAESDINLGGATVEIVPRCGDGICSPGEPAVKSQAATALTCTADCPAMVGECNVPPAAAVGNATLPCGGNGICNPANLLCKCYAGYAVRFLCTCPAFRGLTIASTASLHKDVLNTCIFAMHDC